MFRGARQAYLIKWAHADVQNLEGWMALAKSDKTTRFRVLSILGPGLITGASDTIPAASPLNSQVGAQFGFSATLHVHGVTNIQTSSQAAEALRPVAGQFAFSIFTLGILGTGLLAVPVLAGSAAYAIGEARKWPTGLARQPLRAKAFYTTIAIATLVGVALNFASFNPIQALFWSAVINGVVAVPVMVLMMLLTANTRVMGQFTVTGALRFMGWLATGVMTAAVVGMLVTAGV
jgi:Mn2+/Fe2+ NRAMP family transporter